MVITMFSQVPFMLLLESFYHKQVLCCSVTQSCLNFLQPHRLQHVRFPLSLNISCSLLKLMSIELVMPSNHLVLCHPLFLLPSIFASIRVFSNESALHIWWPKCWSFNFSIIPSSEYSGLISFMIDQFNQRDSQQSSPTQFESISVSVLSLL